MNYTHNQKVIIKDSSPFAGWMIPGTEARVVKHNDRDSTAEYNYAYTIGKERGLLMLEAFCPINGKYVLSLLQEEKAPKYIETSTLINHE